MVQEAFNFMFSSYLDFISYFSYFNEKRKALDRQVNSSGNRSPSKNHFYEAIIVACTKLLLHRKIALSRVCYVNISLQCKGTHFFINFLGFKPKIVLNFCIFGHFCADSCMPKMYVLESTKPKNVLSMLLKLLASKPYVPIYFVLI